MIEVLVVLAIAAILAFVATWGFIERQKRTRVARTQSDMRKLAIAIEAYTIDNSIQPAWGMGCPGPGRLRTCNWDVTRRTGNRSGVADLPSFVLCDASTSGAKFWTLTTGEGGFWAPKGGGPRRFVPFPQYLQSYPVDVFCADRGATFVYWAIFPGDATMALLGNKARLGGCGWITVSPGPDGNYDLPGSYHAYNPKFPQPSPFILAGANPKGIAFTYDPTNGLESKGDIWRVKN